MEINSIWSKRVTEFYIEIVKYYSIIGMSVFYSFIFLGSGVVYYYAKFLKWAPPSFPTEIIATLAIAFIVVTSSVRTFVKNADIIFLAPMETELSFYFRKSMVYSACMDAIKLLVMMVIISPLIKHREIIIIAFPVICSSLIILNTRLTWGEQWLDNNFQKFVHRLVRFVSFSTILYFMFIGDWAISGILVIINSILWFYMFQKKPVGINWQYLIAQEEKSLLKTYKFINIYIDVPHLKYSFKRRKIVEWVVKKGIPYKQSAYLYLLSHLFVRYNEFYYLYIRLTIIGFGIIYFIPASGWIVTCLTLFFSGYQLLPLQYSINDVTRLYPIPTDTIKKSFKKLLMALLMIQLVFLNAASFLHIFSVKAVFMLLIELLFIYWFVYVFASKRIFKQSI